MLFQIQRKNAFSYDTTFGDICQIFDKECGHDRGRGFLGIGGAGYEPQAILHFAPFCRKYGTPLQFVGNYGTINGKHHRTTPQRGGTA
ncbi:MAG TPA: hypothetical protein DCM18_01390 [Ruminococcus sp.]|nr:hypothetical protein [Ruminococcus sp.]HCW12346.1 hypothetical protein [Ruminococcus sp.]